MEMTILINVGVCISTVATLISVTLLLTDLYYASKTKKLIKQKQTQGQTEKLVFHPPYMTEEFFGFPDNVSCAHRIFYFRRDSDMPCEGEAIVEDHEPWCIREGYRNCSGGIDEKYLVCPNPQRINDLGAGQFTAAYELLRPQLEPSFAKEERYNVLKSN